MAVLKLKIDNKHVHLRIFDEKNECLAEVNDANLSEHQEILAEIGKAYSNSFKTLRDLVYFLESPKTIFEGLKIGYELTKDR
jgi:hypothetical protein